MERRERNELRSLNELYTSPLKARSLDIRKIRPGDFFFTEPLQGTQLTLRAALLSQVLGAFGAPLLKFSQLLRSKEMISTVLWLWKSSRHVFSHTLLLLLLYFMRGNWLHLHSHARLGRGVSHHQSACWHPGAGYEEDRWALHSGAWWEEERYRHRLKQEQLRMNTQKTFSP